MMTTTNKPNLPALFVCLWRLRLAQFSLWLARRFLTE